MDWIGEGADGLLDASACARLVHVFKSYAETSPVALETVLAGPVGEENRLRFLPRGRVLGIAETPFNALHQFGAALATGNRFVLADAEELRGLQERLPPALQPLMDYTGDWRKAAFDAVALCEEAQLGQVLPVLAERPGPIVQAVLGTPEFALCRLVKEKAVSVNTAAAGGNASLMALSR